LKHRAPEGFVRNVISTIASGLYKNVASEVIAVLAISAIVILWNACSGFYTDFSGVQHPGILHDTFISSLTLPLAPFTPLSTSLGLLLVFRTNTSYQRWDEARKNWE
jgi:predicted membrane chloride channel (bestrophin family)